MTGILSASKKPPQKTTLKRKEGRKLTEDKIKELSQEIPKLEKEIEELEKEVKPIEDQISSLEQTIRTRREKLTLNRAKLCDLKQQLDISLKQHEIETLKEGDRLWILQTSVNKRGEYDTITQEHAKKRMERREATGTKPHLIEVIEKRHDGAIMAKEVAGKQKYIGFARQRGIEPIIIWQKAAD